MIRTLSSLVALALLSSWLAGPAQAFDGHRVKVMREKIKAFRAKHLPKPPDVKPVEPVKPVVKPGVKELVNGVDCIIKTEMVIPPGPNCTEESRSCETHRGDHGFGRFHPLQRFRNWRHPSDGPDYTPSAPSSHPSLKPVKPEKLPANKKPEKLPKPKS